MGCAVRLRDEFAENFDLSRVKAPTMLHLFRDVMK